MMGDDGFEEYNDRMNGAIEYPDQWWEPSEVWDTATNRQHRNHHPEVPDSILDEHQHCLTCHSCSCQYEKCKIVYCTLACGVKMHQCKVADHVNEICPLSQVPCLNADYGCPLEMLRSERSSHLVNCPASLVVCNYTWNRWTVATKRQPHQLQHFQAGQLDYELALRDQRMEGQLKHIPRKVKVQLRNFLTKRHPVVPIPSSSFREREPKDRAAPDREYNMENENEIDVNMKVYLKQREKQMQQWKQDLTEKIGETSTSTSSLWELPELRKGGVHTHCSTCVLASCPLQDYFDPALWRESCQVVKCKWDCGAKMHRCKTAEHRLICSAYKEVDEFAWLKRLEVAAKEEDEEEATETITKEDKPIALPSNLKIPRPPPIPNNLLLTQLYLSVDSEKIHSMVVKPLFMRNFSCGKMYRRSEVSWHQINIHQQILPGITSGLLQKRCPLANTGCSFSVNFRSPHSAGHQVIFSHLNDDFGCVPPPLSECLMKKPKSPKKDLSKATLVGLPVEILLHIMRRLDAFSLRNISLTCHHARAVVKNLLVSRGCVNLKWEREVKRSRRGVKPSWNVTKVCWFFSSSMTPILRWHQSEESLMQKHMPMCHFNQLSVRNNEEEEKLKSDITAIHQELLNRVKLKRTYIYQ